MEPEEVNPGTIDDEVPCVNCYLTECTVEALRCLSAIDVNAVWTACRIVLGARRAA